METDHSSIRLTCENVVDTERVAMLVSVLEGSRCKNLLSRDGRKVCGGFEQVGSLRDRRRKAWERLLLPGSRDVKPMAVTHPCY